MTLNKLLRDMKRDDLLVTPKLSLWLLRNDHVVVDKAVADHLSRVASTPPRDRSASFSSSSRGSCLRAQVFGFLGAPAYSPADIHLSNIFIDGTWRHLRWQAMLMKAGILTDFEVPREDKKLRLKGSVDGVNFDEHWGFELKGMNTYGFASCVTKDQPLEKHLMQVGTYFIMYPELTRWSLLYEDKNLNHWHEFVVDRNDGYTDAAMDELATLNRHIDESTLPDLCDECKKKLDYKCPYSEICVKATYQSIDKRADEEVSVQAPRQTKARPSTAAGSTTRVALTKPSPGRDRGVQRRPLRKKPSTD
jgi:hypothetical protein